MKRCTDCQAEKDESEFYVKIRRTGRLFSWCKSCHLVRSRSHQKANPQKYAGYQRRWYAENAEACLSRQKTRRLANIDAERAKEREYHLRYRERKAAYRAANAGHIKARNAAYRERAADKIKAYNSRYNRENADAIKARVAKCNAAKPHLYNQLHKAAKHRRKVRMTNNGPCESFTDLEIYERDGWRCGLCGATVDRTIVYPNPMSASLDHRMPIARGGGHTRDNVQLAHLGCNSRKRDRAA